MQIRWLIRRDMDEVVGIDESNGDYGTEDGILKRLGRTDTIGIVCDDGTDIVGYSVYQLGKRGSRFNCWRWVRTTNGRGLGRSC